MAWFDHGKCFMLENVIAYRGDLECGCLKRNFFVSLCSNVNLREKLGPSLYLQWFYQTVECGLPSFSLGRQVVTVHWGGGGTFLVRDKIVHQRYQDMVSPCPIFTSLYYRVVLAPTYQRAITFVKCQRSSLGI